MKVTEKGKKGKNIVALVMGVFFLAFILFFLLFASQSADAEGVRSESSYVAAELREMHKWVNSYPLKDTLTISYTCQDDKWTGIYLGAAWAELPIDKAVTQAVGDYLYACYGQEVKKEISM